MHPLPVTQKTMLSSGVAFNPLCMMWRRCTSKNMSVTLANDISDFGLQVTCSVFHKSKNRLQTSSASARGSAGSSPAICPHTGRISSSSSTPLLCTSPPSGAGPDTICKADTCQADSIQKHAGPTQPHQPKRSCMAQLAPIQWDAPTLGFGFTMASMAAYYI